MYKVLSIYYLQQEIIQLKNCETENRLHLDKKMLDDAKKIMQVNKKNILIAPSSSGPTTMWNTSYFIDLMKKIDSKLDCFFVIAVDSSEREKKIADKIINCFDKNKTLVLSNKTIGQLMAYFMIETIAACYFIGVNPFDQPSVEQGKILTKKYLSN